MMRCRIVFESPAYLEAVNLGHVEQNQVALRTLADRECLRTLEAVTTSKYSADSRASSSLTLAGTSSTTRTRAVTDYSLSGIAEKVTNGLDELAHRDRFRKIGFAARPPGFVPRRPSLQRL
jgi:hypothetical protein